MKNWLRVTICIVLVVSVLAMSLSVFAEDGVEVVQSQEYLMAYYIWVFLSSIGIDVTYRDILEYNDYIQDTIIDWVIEYIADLIEADSQPSNYSIAKWIAPWQASFDYWGNLQFNSTMLEDMQDFAQWLKRKFSLIDDDTVTINPVYRIDGTYTFYEFGKYYECMYQPGNIISQNYVAIMEEDLVNGVNTDLVGYIPCLIENYSSNNNIDTYVFLAISSYKPNQIIGIRTTGLTVEVQESFIKASSIHYNSFQKQNNGDYYIANAGKSPLLQNGNENQWLVPNGNHWSGDYNSFVTFINNLEIETIGDVKVVTLDIEFPVDNPDYNEGDGVIIVDGDPLYKPIVFSGEITNLPAVVSAGTIENPHLEEAYRPIQGLITYSKDGIGVITSLLYELPDEMIYMWYGLLASIVVWGMIKLMREH